MLYTAFSVMFGSKPNLTLRMLSFRPGSCNDNVWFFLLCFTGVFGNIANLAHAGGLLVGIGWGFASAYKWNRG